MQPSPQQSSRSGTPAPSRAHDRLFFALWPDGTTRHRMQTAAEALKLAKAARGRWTPPQRYHLTLQFLGDFERLPPALIDDACAAAHMVDSPAFDLLLDRAGSFRNRSIPWWLGCSTMPEGLHRLWEDLGRHLAKAGVRTGSARGLVPHVTILRDAPGQLDEPIAPVHWRVDSFALIHSRTGAVPGAGYAVRGQWPLRD